MRRSAAGLAGVIVLAALLSGCAPLLPPELRSGAERLDAQAAAGLAPDAWDSTDNARSTGTSLSISTTFQTHGTKSLPHTLGAGGDRADWFRVFLDARATYTFRITATSDGGDASLLVVRVLDPSGRHLPLVARRPSKTVTEYTYDAFLDPGNRLCGVVGWCSLEVTLPSGPPTAYTFGYGGAVQWPNLCTRRDGIESWDPTDDSPTKGTILVAPESSANSHGRHTLSQTDPRDWYRVTLQKGTTYRFDTANGSLHCVLFKSSVQTAANRVAEGDRALTYKPKKTQTYYLLVTAKPSAAREQDYVLSYSVK